MESTGHYVPGRVEEKRHMVRNLIVMMLLAAGLVVAACNTVRGAGEDLESAADTVDNEM
jgi:predicted small secreted protein